MCIHYNVICIICVYENYNVILYNYIIIYYIILYIFIIQDRPPYIPYCTRERLIYLNCQGIVLLKITI